MTSNEDNRTNPTAHPRPRRTLLFRVAAVAAVLSAVVGASATASAWWLHRQLDPPPLPDVRLTRSERARLDERLDAFQQLAGDRVERVPSRRSASAVVKPPERASLVLSERELNALLAGAGGPGDRIRVELRAGRIGALIDIPLPADLPLLGGRTARLRVALATAVVDERLSLRIADVSIGGFPLPNAWLGGLKDVDLLSGHGESGPLRAFAAGIEELRIEDGTLTLTPTS